ncbi:DarT ssDNA thymidine ADP-ribosyltransferase family protein [Neobacillus sp. 114]|uniref:DarT ssDNA thymidine ADP-ribosyltransferase family protein n=1 Tax=Neobacillus sp. 114 TaxID=3048535 RepID=UPI0024C44A75|nr:DarT ssDNA thymidine ADP-ribosyltransferase family protein [Neobacillus sp. 114]
MVKIGDQIEHVKFGTGKVLELNYNDQDIDKMTIAFKSGIKNLSIELSLPYLKINSEYRFFDSKRKCWVNRLGYNEYGFDREGYDKTGHDKNGFDRHGYDLNGFNSSGFNKSGLHKLAGTYYDEKGFDSEGFDTNGFNFHGINKHTRTHFDRDGYDCNRLHKSDTLVHYINSRISNNSEYKFDGFYHMTAFENLASILGQGKFFSRAKRPMKIDMRSMLPETHSVLSNTTEYIQNCVRFYFRPKTGTFYHFEQALGDKIAIIKLNKALLSESNAKIAIGNAGSKYCELIDVNVEDLKLVNIDLIFHSSGRTNNNYEKNLRQSELLIPKEVSTKFIDSIIFRSTEDLLSYKNQYGITRGYRFIVNKDQFVKGDQHGIRVL